MIEVCDLLPEDEILEKSGTPRTSPEAVLLRDLSTDIVGEETFAIINLIIGQNIFSLILPGMESTHVREWTGSRGEAQEPKQGC